MRTIGVFCGSTMGHSSSVGEAAVALGEEMATRGLTLVYGGASVGLMGKLADATLQSGGKVIGVIPKSLMDLEIVHQGLTELRLVETMFQRKAEMIALADAFITLPGGMGTLDELFEVLTLRQLGLHQKPSGLLNIDGYFDPLRAMLDRAVAEGFVSAEHRDLLMVEREVSQLVERCIHR